MQFLGGQRCDKAQVITAYVEEQTPEQLALKYGVNEKTIRRDLERMRYVQKMKYVTHETISDHKTEFCVHNWQR